MPHTLLAPQCPARSLSHPSCPSAHPEPVHSPHSLLQLISHPCCCSPQLWSLTSFPLHMHTLNHPQFSQLWARKKGHDNFIHYYFLLLQFLVLKLSLPQAVLPEILVVIKEKSKVILKHLGERTNINHIFKHFWEHTESKLHVNPSWKISCLKASHI